MISLEDPANDLGLMRADGLVPGEEGSGQHLEGEVQPSLITHQINHQKKKNSIKSSFAQIHTCWKSLFWIGQTRLQ